ncbi:MAG: hypothetical protein ACJAYU_001110 [Bradymonadia bacterium]|jgi:hypothetical protein
MDLRNLGLPCNNRCVFCAQRGLDEASDSLQTQLEPGLTAFIGGDPTVDGSLEDRVRAARDAGAERVLVQTNGRRLAYSAYLEQLVDAGVTHFDISLHGPEPRIHDYHTQSEGSFKQTVRGILNVSKQPVALSVTTVVTRSNFRHLDGIARLLRKLQVKAWLLSAARPLGAALTDSSAVPPRLGMLPRYLKPAIRDAHGIEMTFSGIPACVVPSPRAARFLNDDGRGLSRAEPCVHCSLQDNCTGPALGYPPRSAAEDLTPFETPIELRGPSAVYAGLGVTE